MSNSIELVDIYNDYTINIFSDASSKPGQSSGLFCYGSIIVNKDNILESFYNFHDDCKSSYDAELLGLRASLYAALNYKHRYYNQIKVINIFSDNKSAITAVNHSNRLSCKFMDGDYVSSNPNKSIPYLEYILNECAAVLNELRSTDNMLVVNLYHQPGHIFDKFNRNKLDIIENNFMNANKLDCSVSNDFIIYISKYNCIVDECTGLYIKDYIFRENNSAIPVTTIPYKFKHPDTPKEYYTREE